MKSFFNFVPLGRGIHGNKCQNSLEVRQFTNQGVNTAGYLESQDSLF